MCAKIGIQQQEISKYRISYIVVDVNTDKEVNMRNQMIRDAAMESGVRLWEVAERVGIADCNFSRKLRQELPPDEQTRIVGIIHEIAAEKEAEHEQSANH